jgi:DNA polymerase III delta subunit
MIYIVHGENFSYSRNIILNQQKKLRSSSRTEIAINDISPNQLKDVCNSFDMFGTPPFIVLDISKAGRMNLEPYIEAVTNLPVETTLIIMSSKDLPVGNFFIKNAAKIGAKVVKNERKISSNIFKFIDSVFNGRRETIYKELSKLMKDDVDQFYLFSMILYGARKNHNKFGDNGLKTLFMELYKIDKNVKTGNISPELFIPYTIEKILYARISTI